MRSSPLSFGYQNPLKLRFDETFFGSIPRSPGVYFMKSPSGEILYIGKAKCLRTRLSSYRNAKLGQVGENVIEMLERVRKIKWELHETEQQAFERERELIRAFVPPFNIADAWEESYFYIGLREKRGALEFLLTSQEEDAKGFELHGCYAHRRVTRSAYSALLRLLWACANEKARFSFPAKLTRAWPAYSYSMRIRGARTWRERVSSFLRGNDIGLLEALVVEMLENENIPAFARHGLQDDLKALMEFHRVCLARVPEGLRRGPVSHERMRTYIKKSLTV